jgi:hypothetical protein
MVPWEKKAPKIVKGDGDVSGLPAGGSGIPPKEQVSGKGEGETKLTAYVRCVQQAEKNLYSAKWADRGLGIDFAACEETACYQDQ